MVPDLILYIYTAHCADGTIRSYEQPADYAVNFLKNIALNLTATCPAAVMCVWLISIAAVSIFGSGPIASSGLGILGSAGAVIIIAFGNK
jgi:hypothetical protein